MAARGPNFHSTNLLLSLQVSCYDMHVWDTAEEALLLFKTRALCIGHFVIFAGCRANLSALPNYRHVLLRLPDCSLQGVNINICWTVGDLKGFVMPYTSAYGFRQNDFWLTINGKLLVGIKTPLQLYCIQKYDCLEVHAKCCMLGGARSNDAALNDQTNDSQEVTPNWRDETSRKRSYRE